MKNLFTAPDIIDLLREKKFSLHLVLFMFLAGTILVLALIGAYHLTRDYFVRGEAQNTTTSSENEGGNTGPTIESRLAELGDTKTQQPNMFEIVSRAKELQGSPQKNTATATPTREDRMKELQ